MSHERTQIVNTIYTSRVHGEYTRFPEPNECSISRNGKLLEEFLKQTNTTATNTLPVHTGTWTRENRNNNNDKSVIDYVIISNNLINKITESTTDDTSIFPIKGKHRTDPNIITTKINIQEQLTSKTIKDGKRGSTQDWENNNKELKKT